MTTYARCASVPGAIIEIINLPAGLMPAEAFHADVAATIYACPATATAGEILNADGTVSAAPAPTYTLAQLEAQVTGACAAACQNVVAQITPDANHSAAFQNAASILNGNAGVAPSGDPLKTAFANLAAAFGASSASAFATLILAVQKASLDLLTAQTALTAAAKAATAAQGASGSLQAPLSAFETSLAAVVSELVAAGATITAPPAISIVGVNA